VSNFKKGEILFIGDENMKVEREKVDTNVEKKSIFKLLINYI